MHILCEVIILRYLPCNAYLTGDCAFLFCFRVVKFFKHVEQKLMRKFNAKPIVVIQFALYVYSLKCF